MANVIALGKVFVILPGQGAAAASPELDTRWVTYRKLTDFRQMQDWHTCWVPTEGGEAGEGEGRTAAAYSFSRLGPNTESQT